MKAGDVMTAKVLTIRSDTSLAAAIALMVEKHVSGLPVVDAEGRLEGILTEGDLLHRAENDTCGKPRSKFLEFLVGPGRAAHDYVSSHSRRVGDLMTRDVTTVTMGTPLEDVVDLMERGHLRRVPVVESGILVGIVSRLDLIRAVGRQLAAEPREPGSDAAVEARVDAELRQQKWVAANNVSLSVHDGVVTLDGVIYDERCRHALVVAAQNVPGVTAVVDKLSWIDPNSGLFYTAA